MSEDTEIIQKEEIPPQPRFDPLKETCDWVDGRWVVAYKYLVPDKVAMWAFKEAVASSGQIVHFHQSLNGLPEPDRTIAVNRWTARPTMERASDITKRLKKATGWTQKQLNDIFVDAWLIEQKDQS